ncbi:MAG: DUF4340 domain-containing protein [Planctomycetota bacterium]
MNLTQRNVVLAVIAGVLAVPTLLQWQRDAESFVEVGSIPLLFDGFTADNVGHILLAMPKKDQPAPDPNNSQQPKVAYDRLAFQRSDKGWMLAVGQDLAGAPVSKDRVESDVFAHLRAIRCDREALVQPAASPEQLEKYGLDDKHAFVVQVKDTAGTTMIAELLVGNDAGAGQTGTEAVRGVFVRKSDSTDVVLYEFDKGWRRDVTTDTWLDKVIAKLETDKIQRLKIRNAATAGVTFTFARSEGKASWTAVEPPAGLGAVRQAEVESLVQRLRWIAAQDVRMHRQRASNLAQLGLQPPAIEIELAIKEVDKERVINLGVGGKVEGKNENYLLCNESQFLLTWPAGTVTPFEVDVKAQWFDPVSPDAKPADAGKGEPTDDKKGEKKDDKKTGG